MPARVRLPTGMSQSNDTGDSEAPGPGPAGHDVGHDRAHAMTQMTESRVTMPLIRTGRSAPDSD
jgi:hypothetical protein